MAGVNTDAPRATAMLRVMGFLLNELVITVELPKLTVVMTYFARLSEYPMQCKRFLFADQINVKSIEDLYPGATAAAPEIIFHIVIEWFFQIHSRL
jgi:hypothetical protein